MADSAVHIFGIRHHGPGSARSLRDALESLEPDCILVEGPPDAEGILSLSAREEMKPPVALLVYDPEKPERAAFYPFAEFSPEWQAIRWGLSRGVPVRFMDLPQSVQMGLDAEKEARADTAPGGPPSPAEGEGPGKPSADAEPDIVLDPLSHLARAAGYSDSERWWEHMVEHRREGKEIFSAVLEAMAALREAAIPSSLERRDPEGESRREAHMRRAIRGARKEGFRRTAVVCGAWHAPALAEMPPAAADAAILKGLPGRKVVATWIPWTYGRLAFKSGYGAGVESPGWYDFLWRHSGARAGDLSTGWLVTVARLLRGEDLDASSASVIEAVRLAESLAALRARPLPGLPELNEATQSVLCFGDTLPLRLIGEKLIVGERLGEVPRDTPMVPLAEDLARQQRRLRLRPEAAPRQLDLDLRSAIDLDRSRLLHRLQLLRVNWGTRERRRGSQKGTFHELWRLEWQPELAVALIEAGVWGNTIPAAASEAVRHAADTAPDLPALTALLDSTLLADLPNAAERLMSRIQEVAAVASDVGHLMGALPPLANILRYGNVRKTDAEMVAGVVDGLVARITIGLPGACGSLGDEAAEEMFDRIIDTHAAIGLLEDEEQAARWSDTLRHLADSPNLHGLVAGRACRLLYEAGRLDAAEAARRFRLALSLASAPALSAAWADGFLRRSGILLLHDEALWNVLDEWLTALAPDHFTIALPLLRRTSATFTGAERRQMGERVASGPGRPRGHAGSTRGGAPGAPAAEFDEERANRALPLVARLLGLEAPGETRGT